jgi:phage terminase large subunit-like protein
MLIRDFYGKGVTFQKENDKKLIFAITPVKSIKSIGFSQSMKKVFWKTKTKVFGEKPFPRC